MANTAAEQKREFSEQEKAEQAKVERERDIMRDPHEVKAKEDKKTGAHPMPSYVDSEHPGKTVSALRIKEIKTDPRDARKATLFFIEPGFGPVTVDAPWITANNPRPGGWYVVDANGRRFVNYQDFEKQYRSRG